MPANRPPLLSELQSDTCRLKSTTSRRRFLVQAPVFAAGLAACTREAGQDEAATDRTAFNSDSKLDTALEMSRHDTISPPANLPEFHRYDPALPPLSADRTLRVHWRAREVPVRISGDTTVGAWTFEGDTPGPVLHVRQGDTIEFTLTNEGAVPHSMDFHAAQIDPKLAFRSVLKGESVSFTFRPRFPGAFMYHCGTSPVLLHIGKGMFGALIVDPHEPLPEAREFVLVQSEWYLSPGPGEIASCDYRKMLGTVPDHVVFNGRPGQYQTEPIRVRRGERVRFYVVSAGPSHPCNFHLVGEQFDATWLGSTAEPPLRGVQTFGVAPGGGMVFEMIADIAGEFPFVNHGFGHGQKGGIGFLVVEE
ncbi:MAG: multicopper oxidase domain-containing protein [Gemmatimonadales bacterium]